MGWLVDFTELKLSDAFLRRFWIWQQQGLEPAITAVVDDVDDDDRPNYSCAPHIKPPIEPVHSPGQPLQPEEREEAFARGSEQRWRSAIPFSFPLCL